MADSDRVAELKRKMQEKAQQIKAEAAAKEAAAAPQTPAAPAAPAAPQIAKPTATSIEPENAGAAAAMIAPQAAPVPLTEAIAEASGLSEAAGATAGVVAQAAAIPVAAPAPLLAAGNGAQPIERQPAGTDPWEEKTLSPEQLLHRDMNRREFLTYAWGGALGLVGLATGVGTFQFMYPRFRAGEFGGLFFVGTPESMPSTEQAPIAEPSGKFWLVNTVDEGVKAIYMVCTHLGCLYKWEPSTVRFECPCHGSKFTREGYYIEGPAPRSLDRFELSEQDGQIAVNTGRRIMGDPAADSPARAA